MLDAVDAHINPADRGFLLGDGVFETIRAVDGRPWHLDRHLARLRRSADVLGIELRWPDKGISDAVCQISDGFEVAAVRVTLSRGAGARGVWPVEMGMPTLLVSAAAFSGVMAPVRCVVATVTRRNEFSPLCAVKSTNYLDSILARREAVALGADEAVLLNTAGRVAEACAGNMFFRVDGRWMTPFVREGALPGIARGLILDAGLAVEGCFEVADLARVSASFVSSSLGLRVVLGIGAFEFGFCELREFLSATRPRF